MAAGARQDDHAHARIGFEGAGEVIVGERDIPEGPVAAAGGSDSLARPKSSTFTTPLGVILMFAGFRSR